MELKFVEVLEVVRAENGYICYFGDQTWIAKDEWELKDIIKEAFNDKNVSNRRPEPAECDNDFEYPGQTGTCTMGGKDDGRCVQRCGCQEP